MLVDCLDVFHWSAPSPTTVTLALSMAVVLTIRAGLPINKEDSALTTPLFSACSRRMCAANGQRVTRIGPQCSNRTNFGNRLRLLGGPRGGETVFG